MAQKPTAHQGQQPRRVPLHQQSVRPSKPEEPQTPPKEPDALAEDWDDEPAAPAAETPAKVPPAPIDVGAGKPLNKVPSKFRKLL